MDLMRLYDSKLLIAKAVLVILLCVQCRSTENLQEAIDAAQESEAIEEQMNDQVSEVPAENRPNPNPILVTYKNASSNITIALNPDVDQFYLDLKGMAPSDKDSVVVMDTTIIQNRAIDIQTLLSSYRKAQDLFYLGEYRDALTEVDKTLEIQETADAYALKGTIFFMMENITAARANWNRAVQMDPNIPVPSIPELETLINEIREDDGQ